jgi:altronate hydrolase
LTLGLNCGGSDSFSGITANPALGYCCDCIVREGGTVVLAETTEIFGAEHILARRAKDKATARKLLDCVESYKAYLRQFGGSFNDNPSPGNKKGGWGRQFDRVHHGTWQRNWVPEYPHAQDQQQLRHFQENAR